MMKKKRLIAEYDVVLSMEEQEKYDLYRSKMNAATSIEEVIHYYHLAMFVLKQATPIQHSL